MGNDTLDLMIGRALYCQLRSKEGMLFDDGSDLNAVWKHHLFLIIVVPVPSIVVTQPLFLSLYSFSRQHCLRTSPWAQGSRQHK